MTALEHEIDLAYLDGPGLYFLAKQTAERIEALNEISERLPALPHKDAHWAIKGLLGNRRTPANALQRIADMGVMTERLLTHPNIDPDWFNQVVCSGELGDEWEAHVAALAHLPETSARHLADRSTDRRTLEALADNPHCHAEALAALAGKDEYPEVQERVAKHPTTPPDALMKLYDEAAVDSYPTIRQLVVDHSATPAWFLSMVAFNDEEPSIAQAATMRIAQERSEHD